MGNWPKWFEYIRVQQRTIIGSDKPPDYVVSFGPRNICVPYTRERRTELLVEGIKNWLLNMMQNDLAIHNFEPVGGEFPNTCKQCACFRDSANHRVDVDELAALRKDKERLDWLEGQRESAEWLAFNSGTKTVFRPLTPLFRLNRPITREAIDAAQSQEQPAQASEVSESEVSG